jgi:CDP-paratose 2-epimerase
VPIGEEAQTSPVDIPLYISDYGKASRAFDWQPQRSVRTIVEDIAGWLRENEAQLKAIFT